MRLHFYLNLAVYNIGITPKKPLPVSILDFVTAQIIFQIIPNIKMSRKLLSFIFLQSPFDNSSWAINTMLDKSLQLSQHQHLHLE